jgi:regulatory protein
LTSLRPSDAQGRRATTGRHGSALDVALRFLAHRPRSEHEVRQRLRRAGVDAPEVDRVLAQLREHGLVNDADFALMWVEQRQTLRPRGARLLRAELRQRGVDAQSADAAASSVEPSAEQSAYQAALKRARQLASTPRADADERAFKHRLSQFLARRGFDWTTIAPVVDRLWLELGELSTSSGSARAPTA